MGFEPLDAKARQKPAGNVGLNRLFSNNLANEDLLFVEHTLDGKHNSLEVPRAVGLIRYSGSYSIHGSSSAFITAVSTPGTGTVELTLSSGKFSAPLFCRITPMDASGDTVPWLAQYEITSETTISVHLRKLATIGGDTWNATNGSFAIAIHALPYSPATARLTQPTALARGANLAPASWNGLVDNQAKLRSYQLAEHSAGGAHNTKEIPIGFLVYRFSDTNPFIDESLNVDDAVVSGDGVDIELPGSTYTAPFPVFGTAHYDELAGQTAATRSIVCIPEDLITTTNVSVYTYAWDGAGWGFASLGFSVMLHRGT